MSSESSERCYDLEHVKWRVLSHMIASSVLAPRKALDGVAGQKVVLAFETFLHEVYLYIREDVLLNYLLPKSLAPEILREERKLIQGESSPIDVVTVGWTTNKSCCSRSQSVPARTLHLCGPPLERLGFGIGAHIGVFLGENELILRPVSGCVEGADQAEGGVANG